MVGNKYNCKVQNDLIIDMPQKAQITFITGNHLLAKSNNDGIYFYAYKKMVHYFPTGLEKFYNNLNGIYITHSQLKEIHQNDLKFYTKLEFLDLFDNDIEIIEDDLFKFNPNLEAISLHSNKVFHVGPNVFNGLIKLHSLSFVVNRCADMFADNDFGKVGTIISDIMFACNDHNYLRIEDEFKKLNKSSQNLKDLESELKNSSLLFSSYIRKKLLVLSSIKLSMLLDEMSTNKLQDINISSINDQINKLEGIFDKNEYDAIIQNRWMLLMTYITSLIQIIILSFIFIYCLR